MLYSTTNRCGGHQIVILKKEHGSRIEEIHILWAIVPLYENRREFRNRVQGTFRPLQVKRFKGFRFWILFGR